jgi:dihydropyrimidinase
MIPPLESEGTMTPIFDSVIRGGTVVTSAGVTATDVAIRDGGIAALGRDLGPARDKIDATGRLVLPGGIDPHAHVEQLSGMGLMNADSFETATRSAAIGGTTTVISFAAQTQGERPSDTIAAYAALARRGAMVDYAFHLMVTDPTVPGFAEDLVALAAEGHRSVKVFTTYAIGLPDAQILDVMTAAKAAGAVVCVHAETDALLRWMTARLLAAGLREPRHHALAHPRMAEVEAVERICRFAEFLAQPVMLFHISTAEAAAAVRAARARGTPVRAETCPHYLLQTAELLDRPGIEGAKWMCSPPQRTPADQEALWAALEDGTLDLVSSDHAPYRMDATGKLAAGPAPSFERIANGLPGLETRLPLLFDAMVTKGRGGVEAFARLTATAPARLYGLERKGEIAPGFDADLVLWDPERRVTYGADDLHDNAGYNPWEGHTVTGWPETVLLRGEVLVSGGRFHGTPGTGRRVPRPAPGFTADLPPAPEVRFVEGQP